MIEKAFAGWVIPVELDDWLSSQECGGKPVDDRPDIVFVENPAQPFIVNFRWFLIPLNQILGGPLSNLLAAGVEIAVAPPHLPFRDKLRVFVFNSMCSHLSSSKQPPPLLTDLLLRSEFFPYQIAEGIR